MEEVFMASLFYPYLQNVEFIINYVFILFYDIQFLSLDYVFYIIARSVVMSVTISA